MAYKDMGGWVRKTGIPGRRRTAGFSSHAPFHVKVWSTSGQTKTFHFVNPEASENFERMIKRKKNYKGHQFWDD